MDQSLVEMFKTINSFCKKTGFLATLYFDGKTVTLGVTGTDGYTFKKIVVEDWYSTDWMVKDLESALRHCARQVKTHENCSLAKLLGKKEK